MGRLYDVLAELAPPQDEELAEGYRRYEALLAKELTPEQIDEYANYVHETGTVRVFDEMTPDELAALPAIEGAVATIIMADEYTTMENRRIAALLNQRGMHEVAPDFHTEAQA